MRTAGVLSSDKGGFLERFGIGTNVARDIGQTAGTRHGAGGSSHMEHVTSRTPDDERPAPSGRGALGWTVFLVILVVAAAAVFAGAIRAKLSPDSRVQPSLTGAPSPSPSPLPRPGPAPPGTMIAGL